MTEIISSCIKDAWPKLLLEVLTHGKEVNVVADDTPRKTLEIPYPVMVRIEQPLTDMIPKGSKWIGHRLEAYGNQMVYGENCEGFCYTYHDRLFSYPYKCIDQIEKIIKNLKADRSSRKELSITWNPEIDLGSDQSVPCMILIDFKLRDNKLNATIYMRSWDTGSAAPANLYAFAKLLEYVAGEVKAVVGFMVVVCSAAHIYQEDLPEARFIAGLNP